MSAKPPLNEQELDELLRRFYLEENSKAVSEAEAEFVFEKDYGAQPDPQKEQALLKRLQKNRGGFGGFRFYSLALLSLALIMALVIYLFKSPGEAISEDQRQTAQSAQANQQAGSAQTRAAVPVRDEHPQSSLKMADTFGRPAMVSLRITIDTLHVKDKKSAELKPEPAEKSVPFITEKDKIRYGKIKEQMLSKLIKSDKGLYTHVPAGKISYKDKPLITDAFTIRNMGISNLEYRTFLADLLIQKRSEDYATARVHAENWAEQGCNELAASYFESEAYNDLPVVNVTYEGAVLFCKWLEEETKLYMQQNRIKPKIIQVRLPYDEEWIGAAREGYAKIAFEKGYNTIYDESEGLVDRSFTSRVELVRKRVKRVDTLYELFTTNRYGWTEKEIIDFYGKGANYYTATAVDTIYPDRMKVLGKIGRVSEMVSQRNSEKIWLPGLSWKTKDEYLRLETEFRSRRSSPFAGFRIVIVDPADPEYKNPFW